MLIATPYRDYDVRDIRSPPRIICEIRKNYNSNNYENIKPKITGDVLIRRSSDQTWNRRKVSIHNGQMYVQGEQRIPLRHLSLQAGPLSNSLSLCRGPNIVLTLQTGNELDFDRWVKTIAIELIRQTPLDAIKYLDILTIADCWKRHQLAKQEDLVVDWSASPEPQQEQRSADVEDLLKKCQNAENYVPVKDKLFLFESLCKMGRKVRSSEDVSHKSCLSGAEKRTRSMHDLSQLSSAVAVREICKYFETKSDAGNLPGVPGKAHTNDLYTFRKIITT